MAVGQQRQISAYDFLGRTVEPETAEPESTSVEYTPVDSPVSQGNISAYEFLGAPPTEEEEEERKRGIVPVIPSKSPENIEDSSFDRTKFQKNIASIKLELVDSLKRKYGTEDVVVRADDSVRSMETQAENVQRKASGGYISLHNFGAGADFHVFIDGKQVTGRQRDSSLQESTEPFQLLGGIARKHGYFWGWGDDSKHIAQTRFVHQFIEQNPDYAFTDAAKSYYQMTYNQSTLKSKPLLEKLDEIYGITNDTREYSGEPLTAGQLLEPVYIDAVSKEQGKTLVDKALLSEVERVKTGDDRIDVENTLTNSPAFEISPMEPYSAPTASTAVGEPTSEEILSQEEFGLKPMSDKLGVKATPAQIAEFRDKMNFPLSTADRMANDILTNGDYSYLQAPEGVIPEAILLKESQARRESYVMAPETDAWTSFENAVRDMVGDEPGPWQDQEYIGKEAEIGAEFRELVANAIVGTGELAVGTAEFVKSAGDFIFAADPEFFHMVGGMMMLMQETPGTLIEATGLSPVPGRNVLSGEEGRAVVKDAQAHIWANPVAPLAVAAGLRAIPHQFHNARVGFARTLNTADAALHYLKRQEKTRSITDLLPEIEFTPEMLKMAEDIANAPPPFRTALENEISRNKQIEINFNEAVNPPKPKKKSNKTNPNDVLPLDNPLAPSVKPPSKGAINRYKKAERSKHEIKQEEALRKEMDALISLKRSTEAKLSGKEKLTESQKGTLQSTVDKANQLIIENAKQMSDMGINPYEYFEMGFILTKAQARWVYQRVLKGSSIAVSKFKDILNRGPIDPVHWSPKNEYFGEDMVELGKKFMWQENKLNQMALKDNSAIDAFMRGFMDSNWDVRKAILKSDAPNALKTEALGNLDLVRGANSKSFMEVTDAINMIEEGMKPSDVGLLNRYIQAFREIEIYKMHQKKLPEMHAEFNDLKGKKRTRANMSRMDELKVKIKNAEDYEYSLSHIIDEKTGKRIKDPETGKYISKTPHEQISTFQKYVKGQSLERPDIHNKAMQVFDLYKENLKEMYDAGLITKEAYNDLSHWKYQQKSYIDKLGSNLEQHTPLGKRTISVRDNGIKALKAGSGGGLNNNWAGRFADAISQKNQLIFENIANNGLAEFIKLHPDNGFAKILKPGEKLKGGWKTIEYKKKGVATKIALAPEIHKGWVKSDPVLGHNAANHVSWWSGTKITKAMATGYNPVFALTNMSRDIAYMWLTTNHYSNYMPIAAGQMVKDYAVTAKDAFGRKGRYKDYINEGGGMSWLSLEGNTQMIGGLHRNKRWASFKKAMGYVGETSEVWTRLALRNRAINNGFTNRMATHQARNYLDFAKGGRISKALDSGIPYLNAGIQASYGLFRGAKNNPKNTLIKASQIGMVSSYLWFHNNATGTKTNEQGVSKKYKDYINPYILYNNHVILVPGSEKLDEHGIERMSYMTIPKDSGQKLMSSLTNAILEYGLGDGMSGDEWLKLASMSISEMTPVDIQTALPPTAAIAYGWWLNKDSRTGYDLSTQKREADAKYHRNWTEPEYINDLSNAWNESIAGDVFTVSPAVIENLTKKLAIDGNPYVQFGAHLYEEGKESMGKEVRRKGTGKIYPIDAPLAKELTQKFYRTTGPINYKEKDIVKNMARETETMRAANNEQISLIHESSKYDSAIDAKEEVIRFIKTIKDPSEMERLLTSYETAVLEDKVVRVSTYFIKSNKNRTAQDKAFALWTRNTMFISEEQKNDFWGELAASGFLNKNVLTKFAIIANAESHSKLYIKMHGEDAYDRLQSRMKRVRRLAK